MEDIPRFCRYVGCDLIQDEANAVGVHTGNLSATALSKVQASSDVELISEDGPTWIETTQYVAFSFVKNPIFIQSSFQDERALGTWEAESEDGTPFKARS